MRRMQLQLIFVYSIQKTNKRSLQELKLKNEHIMYGISIFQASVPANYTGTEFMANTNLTTCIVSIRINFFLILTRRPSRARYNGTIHYSDMKLEIPILMLALVVLTVHLLCRDRL